MHRTDAPGATVDNKFTDGDPVGGVQSTMVDAAWLNDVQENIMAVLVAAGVPPNKGRAADLLDSIKVLGRGRLIGVQVFTASGTYTPTAGMISAVIEAQGAGGGGAGITTPSAGNISLGAPGGAGAYAMGRFLAAAIGASQAVTVGAGGTSGSAAAGGSGGSSSVGALISCLGGIGGGLLNNQVLPVVNGNGGATASPAGGNISSTRGVCNSSSFGITASFGVAGFGGASKFGLGGNGGIVNGSGGLALNYGAGGGGTCGASGSANLAGGAGFGGIVIIWEYA